MENTAGSLAVKLPWQDEQWQRLEALRQSDKLPHAILLAGPAGVGKRRFAKAFAEYLICESPDSGVACGTCRQCGFILAGSHPDFKWLAPEEKSRQIKIDQIRELVDSLAQTSQQGGIKVATISPAEMMNTNAANALLKCLEEPSPNTLLLLLADAPNQLLPTIRSRCQIIKFPLPPQEVSLAWLATMTSSQTPVEELLLEAAGQPISVLELLQSDGLERRQQFNEDFLGMLEYKIPAIVVAEKWLAHDLTELLEWLARKLGRLIKCHMGGAAVATDHRWLSVVPASKVKGVFVLLDEVNALLVRLNRGANPNRQLALEALLLNSCERLRG
ncbi:MAG: DNA polymerase III subunit delta' [Spongiibacteraceae bacterium]